MASNKTLVPEAKKALEQFKMEAASEVGVPATTNRLHNKLNSLKTRHTTTIRGGAASFGSTSFDLEREGYSEAVNE